ncbi:MAG: hypothetical protein FWD17_06745 [Polyangiaceae bacterium]|nr:hypothetical protein [Polyangiaceae bacterium]
MTTHSFELNVFAAAMAFSVVGFVAGAALVASGLRWATGRKWLDAALHPAHPAVPLALGLVVVLGVVPHLYEEIGIAGPVLLAAGFALHRLYTRRATRASSPWAAAATLVVPVLALHSALDGAALAVVSRAGAGVAPALLSLPVALHRVPEGMLLATALLPRAGFRSTLAVAGVMGASTLAAGFGGRALLEALTGGLLGEVGHGLLQAVVAAGVGVIASAITLRRAHDGAPHEKTAGPA